MEGIQVAHAIDGRIRLKVDRVKNDPLFAQDIQRQFTSVPGIERVEANPLTGSVLLTYNKNEITTPPALLDLTNKLTALFPGIDVSRLPELLDPTMQGNGPGWSLADEISGFFSTFNARMASALGGIDLNIILPATLLLLAIRGLWQAKQITLPPWHTLLLLSLATFHILKKPTTVAGLQTAEAVVSSLETSEIIG